MSAAAAAAVEATAPAPAFLAGRNAANAQYSTGPVTAEGKARSSRNALRHGLTSRSAVMPWENEADFLQLRVAFLTQYQPATQVEVELLNRMVECWWKLMRAQRVEAQYLAQRSKALMEADPTLDEEASLVPLFCDPVESRGFRLFLRYYTNVQRSWRTALSEYQQTRKARIEHENENLMVADMIEARRRGYRFDEEDEEGEESREPDHASTPAADQQEEKEQPKAPAKPAGFVSHSARKADAPRPVPGSPLPKHDFLAAKTASKPTDNPATRL